VMRFVGCSIAPRDAHPRILELADFVLEKNGGDGFVRMFVETLIDLPEMDEDEIVKLLF